MGVIGVPVLNHGVVGGFRCVTITKVASTCSSGSRGKEMINMDERKSFLFILCNSYRFTISQAKMLSSDCKFFSPCVEHSSSG